MKKKRMLKASFVLLTVLSILLFTMPYASAETGKWVAKAPMHEGRRELQTEIVNGKIYTIGGYDTANYQGLSSVEEYDPITDKWTVKASLITPRYDFQTVVVDGKIYAIGGLTTGPDKNAVSLSSMEEYDPVADKWTAKASMRDNRYCFQAVVMNGNIYAIGGGNKTMEVYDPTSDVWTAKASMNFSRDSFQAKTINNKIYAIGGDDNGKAVASIEEYDPNMNTWKIKASMKDPRYWNQAEVVDGRIYVFGGYSEATQYHTLATTEEYNPATDTWTEKAPMAHARDSFSSVAADGYIYAISGNASKTMEKYDVANDKWIELSELITPRSLFNAVMMNNTIYAIGGTTYGGYGNPQSLVEAYKIQDNPSLTVTPSADKVTLGNQFTTTIAIHNVSNICAEDIKLNYDSSLFDFVSATAQDGQKLCTTDTSTAGTIRLINASQGIANAATGDKDLITLTFKAKAVGTGKIDITKGRIADNATLEEDVADANCGECSVTVETSKDVNRSGEVTLLDLGIDAGYYGKNASDTDSSKYDADVVPDGKIDGQDLDAIDKAMLENSNYAPNN